MYIEDTNMVCKSCKEDKSKEPIIRNDVTRFVDERGRLWNGKQCPECYKAYNRERMRLKRRSEKDLKLEENLKI
jgi:type II secretory ATPase GspE/PulE/Tfp pilus assembly ATPase PilB-like protein